MEEEFPVLRVDTQPTRVGKAKTEFGVGDGGMSSLAVSRESTCRTCQSTELLRDDETGGRTWLENL